MHIHRIGSEDGPRREELQPWVDVCNAANAALFGDKAPTTSVSRRLAAAGAEGPRVTYFLALPGDSPDAAPLGAASLTTPSRTGEQDGEVEVYVLPQAQRHGVGRVLLDHVEQVARAAGLRSIILDQTSPTDHGGAAAAFAEALGYEEFGRVIGSRLDLPVAEPVRTRLEALADERLHTRYEVFTAVGELPDEWLPNRAALARQLSTQTPSDSMRPGGDNWDAERVRTMIMGWRRGGGTVIESVAVPDGQAKMVAFSDLVLFENDADEATQSDTLVDRDHRGHRLGLAVKLANLKALAEHHPSIRRIRTWTWSQNQPMRDLNRELGFEDDLWTRLWRKDLSTEPTPIA